jgi:outer membrane biosynthesis protein TonB
MYRGGISQKSQLSIKLWQQAQPEQTKKTNQKTKPNPKNQTKKEVMHSKHTHNYTQTKNKTTEHNPNQTPNPYILYSKQQQNHKTTNTHQPTKHTAPATTNTTTNKNLPFPHNHPPFTILIPRDTTLILSKTASKTIQQSIIRHQK